SRARSGWAASRFFLKGNFRLTKKSKDRLLPNTDFSLPQPSPHPRQSNVRLLRHQSPDPLLMRRQRVLLVPAEFGGTDTAGFTFQPQKPADRTKAHAKSFGRLLPGRTLLDLLNHACTQVVGIRLGHPSWP